MDLKYFKNEGDGVYSILLHGEIGKQVDGRLIASEILMLNEMGAKIIKERINTIGGSIIQGYSIVSANLASEAEIHTFNEGVADSTGSWILASGTPGKRGSFDFASVFMHNPTYMGKPIDEIEDEGIKKEMKIMTDSIITILANNSNKSKEEIKAIMDEAKRLTANAAKSAGIIDFVKTSANKPAITANMSVAEIMNVCNEFNKNTDSKNFNNKSITMETVAKFFNLSPEATESAVLAEVQKLQNKAEKAEGNLKTEKEASGKKDTEIVNLKKDVKAKDEKIAEYQKSSIEAAVDAAIKSGKYEDSKKEELVGMAKDMGLENFNKFIEMQKTPHVDVAGNLSSGSDPAKKGDEAKEKELAKEFHNLEKNDSDALAKLEVSDPKKFKNMYEASIKWDVTEDEK